jgi:hypothetical protein
MSSSISPMNIACAPGTPSYAPDTNRCRLCRHASPRCTRPLRRSRIPSRAAHRAAQAREMIRARLRGDTHTLDAVFGFERLSRQNIFPAGR